MVIPVGERTLSKQQYYISALKIHKKIELILLKNFGVKPMVRDLKTFMYKAKMTDEDKELFNHLATKYNIDVITEYPLWILDHYKNKILDKADTAIDCITKAYTIYATSESEFQYRRRLQWDAISAFEEIKQYFSLILSTKVIPVNVNELQTLIEEIDNETKYIRLWKKNDNKLLNKIKKV